MPITPYQIIVPAMSVGAIGYAWNLVMRQKKTIWEAILWTGFWGLIASIASYPPLLGYLTALTGIKSQVNAVLATSIGILFFLAFYIIVRLEELEQRQTRLVRQMALKNIDKKP